MSQSLVSMAGMLEIFALLLSNRWIDRWQKGRSGKSQPTPKKLKKKLTCRSFYKRIFSLRVTLWYLIFQRLNFDTTLAAVVNDVRCGGADRLSGRGGKLSNKLRSTRTSAYNQARQRMPLELLQDVLRHWAKAIVKLVAWERPRQILDGSTLAVLTNPSLAKAYSPARYKGGATDWSIMRIVVGFCARSGAVLSAIEGAVQRSEQALAWKLMEQAVRGTIWIGDSNFGVYSMVAQARRYKQDVLFRLTKARAAKLCQSCRLRRNQERQVQWIPSRHDQVAPGTQRQPITGRLIYLRCRKNGSWIHLWLFTTLNSEEAPLSLLVEWYAQRWQAELNFRSVKTHLKMEELFVSTPQMAQKEFYAGMLAYSLIRIVMWKAGERLEGGIKLISFSQARRWLQHSLKNWGSGLHTSSKDMTRWIKALLQVTIDLALPKRKKPRPSEIRRIRRRSAKFSAFSGSRAAARARYLKPKTL